MLNLRVQKTTSAEAFFVDNYERLLGWALHLTGGDHAVAEDLLHDVFILFRVQELDLDAIQNLDGYLYTMLRNLHISRLRRAARTPLRQLSVVEFDSAETGLRAIGALDNVQLQDQLRRVCEFVCVRKEKAKAVCALILRFFHGYYPSEVARVLRTTRPAVDVRLLCARQEAKLVLENPKALAFFEGSRWVVAAPSGSARHTEDLLNELQEMIFASRQGECPPAEQLQEIYDESDSNPRPETKLRKSQLTQPQLAHIVSCPVCLDEVNRLLNIAPLSQRHPADSVKRKPRGGGKGGDGGSSDGGGIEPSTLTRLRRRAGEVYEHRPQEICISVNGNLRGSQYITSDHSELSLVVDETIQFVEVLSEQGVRLLMLPVGTVECEQSLQINLSDSRILKLYLESRSPSSTLKVLYNDPTFAEVEQLAIDMPNEPSARQSATLQLVSEPQAANRLRSIRNWLRALFSVDTASSFWAKPSTVTALVALLLVTTILLWRLPVPTTVTAAELLSRSTAAEEQASATGFVLHRTITLEESTGAGTPILSRRKIEVWRSVDQGITARRLFGESGQMLAGEWRHADGSQTVYRTPDAKRVAPTDGSSPSWSVADAWRWDLSAADFASRIGDAERAKVQDTGEQYVISYQGQGADQTHGLVEATLILNNKNLQAIAQTLIVGEGTARRQFVFKQSSYERTTNDSVAPSTFEPDAEFLKAGVIRLEKSEMNDPSTEKSGANLLEEQTSDNLQAASLALEVKVLGLLNQIGADLGEQISVLRTTKGTVHVRAVVETQQRKLEILRALKPIADEPSVILEVLTAVEKWQGHSPSKTSLQQVEPTGDRLPVDSELRRYLSGTGGQAGDELEAELLRFAVRASASSRRSLQHAWAVQRLAGRFNTDDLGSVHPEAELNWLAMIRDHSASVRRETVALRQQLQPLFGSSGGNSQAQIAASADADIRASAQGLLDACTTIDALVRSAFSLSTAPSAPEIRSAKFWDALRRAELYAEQVSRVCQRLSDAASKRAKNRAAGTSPSQSPR